jgi:hypothetical protein
MTDNPKSNNTSNGNIDDHSNRSSDEDTDPKGLFSKANRLASDDFSPSVNIPSITSKLTYWFTVALKNELPQR